jgi:SAM-dependent methyltransferase
VDDPALWRALWLSRLESYSSSAEQRARDLRNEAQNTHILPRTRERLLRLAAGFEGQVETIDELFESIQAGADLLPALAIPSRPESEAPTAVLESYENIFRDWVWGQEECDLVVSLLSALVPEEPGRVAVYGPGAGRVAADLHRRCGSRVTVALDVNPLPLLVADKIVSGETVKLLEFPIDPVAENDVVLTRTMTRPYEIREGFALAFADPMRPPFAPGSLDVVLTTWFIDSARADLRQTAAAINRVLRPGGLWVNLGPLRFHTLVSRAHTFEEALDIVRESSFELLVSDRQNVPYLDSPLSGSHRSETALRFSARKAKDAAPVEIPDPFPPWVTNPATPIPITPGLIALGRTSMFTTSVLSMIDGSRSVIDVAQALGAAWHIEPARLQDELRAFLAKLPTG